MSEVKDLVAAATGGQRGALARLLSIAETGDSRLFEIESRISSLVGNAYIIGITGPPGAGKSTLINRLLPHAQKEFGKAAVLAIDPTSPFSNGALLGDRVRMQGDQLGTSIFIRSMASRGETGGLARATSAAVRLFDACRWPVVIIETLGIGQVELDIMNLADTVIVVLNPGWGDSFQANKAGLTEAGDIFAINKADTPGLQQTKKDLLESLSLLASEMRPEVIETTATTDHGIENLWGAIKNHQMHLGNNGELLRRRETKRNTVVRKLITDRMNHLLEEVLESGHADRLIADATRGEVDIGSAVDEVFKLMSKAAKDN